MAAIVVDEFPWVFITGILALLVWGVWVDKYQWAGTFTGLAALVLFLTPVIQTYGVGSTLRKNLQSAFGGISPRSLSSGDAPGAAPFRWTKMLTGINSPAVPYRTFTFARYGDTALTLDFYPARPGRGCYAADTRSGYPANARGESGPGIKRPCVVVIHGGSWSGGDAQQLPELNSVLALEGYNVATINYRLAPRYQNPAPVEDVAAALAYLRTHADSLHIDTDAFVLLGRSAGAQIALLAAYTLPSQAAGSGIKGVISYYGPADMVWGYSIPTSPLIMDSRKVMGDYLGGPYDKVPGNYAASSPIEFVRPGLVPTLLIHGRNDVLVAYEHSTRLARKLAENGVPHFLLSLPWATHGCDYTLNGPSGQLATYSVETFLHDLTKAVSLTRR
jgi:acetyl esterase/lipase